MIIMKMNTKDVGKQVNMMTSIVQNVHIIMSVTERKKNEIYYNVWWNISDMERTKTTDKDKQ